MPALGDSAVEEHEDLVGVAHGGEAVRDEHDHPVSSEVGKPGEQVAFARIPQLMGTR